MVPCNFWPLWVLAWLGNIPNVTELVVLSLDPPVQCPDSVPCEGRFSQQIFFRRNFLGSTLTKFMISPQTALIQNFLSPQSPPLPRRISSGIIRSLNPTKTLLSFDPPRCQTPSRLPAALGAPYASKSPSASGARPGRPVLVFYLRRREVYDLVTSSRAGQSRIRFSTHLRMLYNYH